MNGSLLKARLLQEGATVVGLASVGGVLSDELRHLTTAISIGLSRSLKETTLRDLRRIQKVAERLLKEAGFRMLSIPPDSDRVTGTFVSRLYPLITHKMAATSAGIGWIGRSGLLISPDYGPRLALATVLTDAKFDPDSPIAASRCGDCRLCVEHCPSEAITGMEWSRETPYPDLLRPGLCRSHKASRQALGDRPNCGLCITICPYGRKAA